MKIYIFLTYCLCGYSGGPSYIRNKKIWLEKQGWEVVAFDLMGFSRIKINYGELIEFKNNHISELFFRPSWYNDKHRVKVLDKIREKIKLDANEIVVESNTTILAEWGELLSKQIKAKHLIYLIGENVRIIDDNEFLFLYHKYQNRELFSITPQAFEYLWKGYINVTDSENCYWDSMSLTEPQDVKNIDLENIAAADYTITHFGRLKNYVSDVVGEVCIFADNNKDKKINMIFFGIKKIPIVLRNQLKNRTNVLLYCIESVYPIPKRVFFISDVIIATAGCANIAVTQNVKTISYNVETNTPLGVMQYDTIMSSYSDSTTDIDYSLHKILNAILIEKKYDYSPPLKLRIPDKGYEYQISFINEEKKYYMNVLDIKCCDRLKDKIIYLLCRNELIGIVSLIRYIVGK